MDINFEVLHSSVFYSFILPPPLSPFSAHRFVLKQPEPCDFFTERNQLLNSYKRTQTVFRGTCFCSSLYSLQYPRAACLLVSLNCFASIASSGPPGTVNALLHYRGPIESMCSTSDVTLHVIIDSNYMITGYKARWNYIRNDIRLAIQLHIEILWNSHRLTNEKSMLTWHLRHSH